MNRPVHVLVYPSGAESALEVWHALKHVVNVRVYGASSRSDHGDLCFAHRIEGLGNVSDPEFAERLVQAVVDNRIDAIFPCHDTVAVALAALQPRLSARVVCSPLPAAEHCRSKRALLDLFAPDGLMAPDVGTDPGADRFPLFAKPDVGEGGKGTARLADRAAYDRFFAHEDRARYVVSAYLPGEEFTVDCLTDREGKLRFVGPRTRERVLAGISVRTRRVPAEPFMAMARTINERLALRGLWFFQVKRDALGRPWLLEVSTRTASSMGLHRAYGVNLPLLALYDALGLNVRVMPQPFAAMMDRALTPKFALDIPYSTVYLDLDDTLIMHGRVNGPVIHFAYQCRAQGKRLVLITKHEHDLAATLRTHRIDPALFDGIVHLRADERKSDHIEGPDAILIDNAWTERADALERKGIAVFDVDAIEALIDHHA